MLLNLFFLGLQNSISRRKICMNGRINHFEKVKTTWDSCALHKHILLFLRHLLVYIFTWARVPLRGKFNIGLCKHTLLGKTKLNFHRFFSSRALLVLWKLRGLLFGKFVQFMSIYLYTYIIYTLYLLTRNWVFLSQ